MIGENLGPIVTQKPHKRKKYQTSASGQLESRKTGLELIRTTILFQPDIKSDVIHVRLDLGLQACGKSPATTTSKLKQLGDWHVQSTC